MTNLEQIIIECKRELNTLDIKFCKNITFITSSRLKKSLGITIKKNSKHYIIKIMEELLNGHDELLKSVIIHELLHTVPGCMNHGYLWKYYAKKVNSKYGYNITRTCSKEEAKELYFDKLKFKYIIQCKECNLTIGRQRISGFVRNPAVYICPRCNKDKCFQMVSEGIDNCLKWADLHPKIKISC